HDFLLAEFPEMLAGADLDQPVLLAPRLMKADMVSQVLRNVEVSSWRQRHRATSLPPRVPYAEVAGTASVSRAPPGALPGITPAGFRGGPLFNPLGVVFG